MVPRLWKNILEIQQIESGTLAKCWSDGRNVAKVIANLVQPFCQKQALFFELALRELKLSYTFDRCTGWALTQTS